MKKIISTLLVLMICLSVFAYQNTYRLSSDEVQAFLTLRKATATMTPDPTYPISASQLADLVKSLDSSKLSGKYLEMYDSLLDSLENPQVLLSKGGAGYNFSPDLLGAQFFGTLNQEKPDIVSYKDRLPFFDFVNDFYFKDYFFGRFNLNFSTYIDQYNKKMNLITLKDVMNFTDSWPSNAYASFGFDKLSFIIGRDRLGAGNGFTGNLELGENAFIEDFAKLSYVSDFISYDFTVSSFNHDLKFNSVETKRYTDSKFDGLKKNIFIHRISMNFADKVSVSAYEGALVAATSVFQDLKYFNPFMFMHNTGTYWDASTNNFFGIETTAMLTEKLQLNCQLFLDQICLPGIEVEQSQSGDNAFAALVNISSSQKLGNGIFDYYAECVYGNPYVYLKNAHTYGVSYAEIMEPEAYKQCYTNYDLVLDSLTNITVSGSRDKQFMGYKNGGDLFTAAVGASYTYSTFRFSGALQYLAKGIYGLGAGEERFAMDKTEVFQNSLIASVGVDCKLFNGIDISAKGVGSLIGNYHHVAGSKMKDFQFSVGVVIKPLEFFNIRKSL